MIIIFATLLAWYLMSAWISALIAVGSQDEDEQVTIWAGVFLLPVVIVMFLLAWLARLSWHGVYLSLGKRPPHDSVVDYLP